MRCGAGLHPDQARIQLAREVRHRTPAQLLLQNDGSIGINAVKLKDGLGQIDPERCDLPVGGSFPLLACDSTSMAHCDAVGVEPDAEHHREADGLGVRLDAVKGGAPGPWEKPDNQVGSREDFDLADPA